MKIEDSVIIVTGASGGIGLATAKLLTEQGAKVVLASRNIDKLLALSEDLPNSFVVATDMAKEDDVRQLIAKTRQEFGRIDGLVNNAGRGYDSLIEHIDGQKYTELFRLNVLGPLMAMQQVIPHLRVHGGAIVNVTSGTSLMAIPGIGAYSSTKRALNALSLTTRAELAKDNISVSLVYPYITATQFHTNKIQQSSRITAAEYAAGDPPEKVAELILLALREGKAEYFAHEEMRPHL